MARLVKKKGVVDTNVMLDEEGNVGLQNEDAGMPTMPSMKIDLPERPEPLAEPPKYETEDLGSVSDLIDEIKGHKEEGREAYEPKTESEKDEAFEQPELQTPSGQAIGGLLSSIVKNAAHGGNGFGGPGPSPGAGGSGPSSGSSGSGTSGTQKTKQYASSGPGTSGTGTGPQAKKKDFYDQTIGRAEKILGMDDTRKYAGASVRTTDRLAALGGYTKKSYNTLVDEKRELKEDYDRAKEEYEVLSSQLKYHEKIIQDFEDLDTSRIMELRKKRTDEKNPITVDEQEELNRLQYEYEAKQQAARESRKFIHSSETRSRFYRLANNKAEYEAKLKELNQEFTRYDIALAKGEAIDKEKHNWRNEWARPIAEATSNMLTRPVIGNVTDVVNYGGMTGKTATAGLNELVGGYKTAAGANEWTRTRVGDRQLVEALVSVKPSSMITPFGAPGTVGGGNLQNQFEYNAPLRRIGVGDVTARPGYRINIEDIHRKKKGLSKPQLTRKRVIKKKKPVVNSGIASIMSTMSKINGIKTPGGSGIKTPGNLSYVKNINAVGISGKNTMKETAMSVKKNVKVVKKTMSEPKPFTLKMNAVGAYTPSIIEFNLNTQSQYMKKKKLVKV